MEIVHERTDVFWISDKTRPFVIVPIESKNVTNLLVPNPHIGLGVKSKSEVDRLCNLAKKERCLLSNPKDSGPPVGYWAYSN